VRVRDPKDEQILGTALASDADYLVTGDEDLLELAGDPRLGTLTIVTVVDFLAILYDGGVDTYAFIDGQNLYSGIKQLGWDLATRQFRVYLGRQYGVAKAFYFVGYLPR
jgi:hypothetical protein